MNNQNGPLTATLHHPAFKPVALGLSVAFIVASIALVVMQLPRTSGGTAGASLPSASAGGTVAAYIVGAVLHPGVYVLPTTARVQDLLLAAGGALGDADLVRVNLAAPLFDGEEIYVPRIGEPIPASSSNTTVLVNINLASATALHTQLGVSSKTANAIVAYRSAHGSFTTVDQLLLVPISRAIYDRIKNMVTV